MKQVVVAGHRIEYDWIGPEPAVAPTLVFLHEGLGCAGLWRDFPARIAAETGCGALVYSRLGYGGSDPVAVPRPLTYMQHEGEHALPSLLDALEVRDAVLVGHSDGASIAVVYGGVPASRGRVRGLVLEAPHVFCEELSVKSIAAARDAYEHGDLKRKLARWHGDNVECAFWGWNRAWLDPEFRAWNIEKYLAGISVPVLLVQGADDEYGTLAQVEAIERGCRSAVESVVLEKCGHSPHRDQPDATQVAIVRFVRGLVRDPGPRDQDSA